MCQREYELIPIPDFIKVDPRCIYEFDPTNPEFGVNEVGQECFRIDRCIAPALKALWAAGIKTTGSCCGHGSGSGVVGLLTFRDEKPISQHPNDYRPLDDVQGRVKYYEMVERATLAEVELGHLQETFSDLICKLCGERCEPSD